jgi:hypothetical protein
VKLDTTKRITSKTVCRELNVVTAIPHDAGRVHDLGRDERDSTNQPSG